MRPTWRLGIDIGGTFTDVVAVDTATGSFRTAKVPSVPDDPLAALVAGIAAVGLDWPQVATLTHGTTMVTNDIVQRRFAPVALVATEGFTDTVDIGRMSRAHLYRLDLPPKPPALVPDGLRIPVAERMRHDGSVAAPLTADEVERVARALVATGVEAVAICLLHGYRNPAHEAVLAERLARVVPDVVPSHRISPEWREYERMNTTVMSAGVTRRVRRYLERIEAVRPDSCDLHFFHSAGGMASPAVVGDHPLMLAASGPAAGVGACAALASHLGIPQALTFDMGGTTTDVCLIVDGKAQIRNDHRLAGYRIRLPMVAVESIGAGGGSIARLEGETLRVGPESAGAVPGPACYGKGGTEATVSDADLLLGYLDPARTLGGVVTLQPEHAADAIRPIAEATGFSLTDAALGIVRVAHANMARALRRITVERGVDGRECPLIAFGGAGPMHAVEVARAYGISTVLVPRWSSAYSALGCAAAGMRYARQQTVTMASGPWDAAAVAAIRDGMIAALAAPLTDAGHPSGELRVEVTAALRYSGQSDEILVTAPPLDDPDALGRLFRARHEMQYDFSTDEPWELTALRVEVSAPEPAPLSWPAPDGPAVPEPVGWRQATFEDAGTLDVPCYARDGLGVGDWIAGPAIVEDDWSTIVVPPRDRWRVDADGTIHIAVATASAEMGA